MKLSPSTIAANLSVAAAAEAEAAANSNLPSTNVTSHPSTAVSTTTGGAAALSAISSTSAPAAMMTANPPGKSAPRDTQFIADILKEMGVQEHEPRVLSQLVEFAYRYASQVLDDAQLYSSFAKKKQIDADDVNLTLQMQADRSFVGPPSRDILLEIARHKNAQPLPPIKSHNGMRLPADRYSLVASNLRLAPVNKQAPGSQQTKLAPSRPGMSILSKFPGANANSASKTPTGTDAIGMKRRLEET